MLLLAIFSVGLLVYAMFSDRVDIDARWVLITDTSICGIFVIEFLYRWRANGWARKFPLRNWYEILGMIPVAHPALRGFRLLRLVVMIVRLVRAADRAFGERFVYRLVERLSRPIVLAIKKPITIAVLDEVVKVLETGNYPHNLARSLNENSDQLRAIVTEKVRNDPQAGRFKRVPFHDEIVESVVDTALRVTLEVLVDPRTDSFFAHVVRENREQIRMAVQEGLHEEDLEAGAAPDPSGDGYPRRVSPDSAYRR
ncbi:ion transporter [Haloechinothrix sp. YIM 98757]|uniref:Ion transporter n=1 Tax=Haloechinothrix aidingensis TaxID=2752311 RepID=A0A838ADL7_9PSEU|nr:ion transporter [Haloechinothrix aidingensis]MBA0127313.1 ion transporter [Haloechinothrix aidingensis]